MRRDIAGDIGMVWADELKLRQVLLNLLTNAVKFTPDGGSVEIAARVTDGEVEVSVTDTGIGIAEAERERIFEAFQRGGRTAPTGAEGTGLGLTLTRQIVELHGGRIWMTSDPGRGSTFAFALPRRGAGARAGRRRRGAAPAGTVVVIEDDRRSADLLTLYLEGAGYAVVVAGDGVDGLELVRRVEPVAVILDVRLPRLDGWDVLARLKADPATASLPVVIVSMIDERGRGFALGAAEYLVKPVDRERLPLRAGALRPRPQRAPHRRRHRRRPHGPRPRRGGPHPRGLLGAARRRRRGGRGPGRPRAAGGGPARPAHARARRLRGHRSPACRSGDRRRCRSSC